MSERDELLQLLKSSVSINDADRELFLHELDTFTLTEIRDLLKVFRYEKEKLMSINSRFSQSVFAVDVEFHQLVTDFKHNKFPEALRKNEVHQKQKDEDAANSLLKNLDS